MKRICLIFVILLSIPSSVWCQDLLYDQAATGQYYFVQCMHDSVYPFTTKLCDNFFIGTDEVIDSVVWWGGYWSYPTNQLVDFTIEIYEDSTGQLHPYEEPFYSERVGFWEEDLGGYYIYTTAIPPCTTYADENYFVAFIATIVFPPHWGNNCSWPGQSPGWGDGHEAFFKSDLFGYDEWTPISVVNGDPHETSFQLFSTGVGYEETPDIHRSIGPSLFVSPTTCTHADDVRIAYTLSHPCVVTLEVYNSAGQRVRTLASGKQTPGDKHLRWDMLDNNSCHVSTGTYFIHLLYEGHIETGKMVLIE